MEYSLDQLTTIADCDALLSDAADERFDLNFGRMQQERLYKQVTSASGIEALIIGKQAEITALQTGAATLQDGPVKTKMLDDIKRLDVKLMDLIERRDRYGNLALLKKEYAITCIDKQIAENDAYVAALENRKTKV